MHVGDISGARDTSVRGAGRRVTTRRTTETRDAIRESRAGGRRTDATTGATTGATTTTTRTDEREAWRRRTRRGGLLALANDEDEDENGSDEDGSGSETEEYVSGGAVMIDGGGFVVDPKRLAPGMRAYIARRKKNLSASQHRAATLVVTFIAYALYHASRKPPSIVKSVLNPDQESISQGARGWAPFDGEDGTRVIGMCDFAFLASYSIGMFFSGHIGDRMDLRKFLTFGMIMSGAWVSMFGMGYYLNIHSVWYYVGVQMVAGVFQSTGWPSVVSVVGNWFGKGKRGLVMGVWNSHTSIGNMLGSVLAASALRNSNWGMSFIIPGVLTMLAGVLVWNFLVVSPEDVGLPPANGGVSSSPSSSSMNLSDDEESVARRRLVDVASERRPRERDKAVGFVAALKIPGVITFSLCLFFTKLVAYTFLYWLPFYIERTEIDGKYLSAAKSGELSVIFDLGGIVGGILAGYISDKYNARSMTAAGFVYLSIPVLFMYREYGARSMSTNLALMALSGMLVNGPYALITTAVSADLGTHESLKGNSRALATVTAIIDGTGSIGAAIGPMLTGYITSMSDDWNHVFYMLYAADLIAGLLLTRLILKEARAMLAVSTT